MSPRTRATSVRAEESEHEDMSSCMSGRTYLGGEGARCHKPLETQRCARARVRARRRCGWGEARSRTEVLCNLLKKLGARLRCTRAVWHSGVALQPCSQDHKCEASTAISLCRLHSKWADDPSCGYIMVCISPGKFIVIVLASHLLFLYFAYPISSVEGDLMHLVTNHSRSLLLC